MATLCSALGVIAAPAASETTGKAAGNMGVKRKSTTNINQALIAIPGPFYYVEIQNTSDLLEVLGVEIDVQPAC